MLQIGKLDYDYVKTFQLILESYSRYVMNKGEKTRELNVNKQISFVDTNPAVFDIVLYFTMDMVIVLLGK